MVENDDAPAELRVRQLKGRNLDGPHFRDHVIRHVNPTQARRESTGEIAIEIRESTLSPNPVNCPHGGEGSLVGYFGLSGDVRFAVEEADHL